MPQSNAPVTNPELTRLLAALHQDNTPENQEAVLREVLYHARFLAPVVMTPTKSGDAAVQFQLIQSRDKRPFLPAFTDWPELRKLCGPRDQQTLVMTFDDYARAVAATGECAGFVINPFGCPLTLERPLIQRLFQRKRRDRGYGVETIAKDTQVRLSDPDQPPQALLDAACMAAAGHPEILRLWLRLLSRPGQPQPGYLLVVEHTGEQDRPFSALARAAQPHLEGRQVDMVSLRDPLGQAAAKDAAPFFSRI